LPPRAAFAAPGDGARTTYPGQDPDPPFGGEKEKSREKWKKKIKYERPVKKYIQRKI
jgi:hypothetical protein